MGRVPVRFDQKTRVLGSGSGIVHIMVLRLILWSFCVTRPKPAYGRQGLDSDRWARIQFSQVHFGPKTLLLLTRGPNRPFR